MPSGPAVDVVVSTHRYIPYLHEALGSVQAQTWRNWRLTLVDDGCPDPDALRSAAEAAGGRVVRQERSGLPAARNTGIRSGRGDLIAFLDDDDIWHPEKLERQVHAWLRAPEHVAVYSAGWYMDREGMPLGGGWPARQEPSDRFIGGEVPLPRIVTLLVRRDVCEGMGGFNATFSQSEDNEFILRLVQRGELLAVPEELVGYRRHGGNMSAVRLSEGRAAGERLLKMQIDAAESRRDPRVARLLRQNRTRFRQNAAQESAGAAVAAARAGDWRTSSHEAAWAVCHAPATTLRTVASKAWRSVSPRRR